MSDLRCRQCGARMQPAEQWCSLCHAPKQAAVPGPRSGESDATDQTAGTPQPGRRRSKHAAPSAGKPRLGSTRSRVLTAAVVVAVAGTGTAIALSAGGGSSAAHQHEVSPAGKPPSGTTFGVLPGKGTPSNIPLPGRVSR